MLIRRIILVIMCSRSVARSLALGKNYNPHLNADSVLLICHMNFISCSKKTRLIHSCALNFQKQSTFECRFGTLIFLLDMCHFTFAQKKIFATINNKSLQVLPKCSENVRIVECSPAHLLSMTEAFCRKINMSFGPQIALDLWLWYSRVISCMTEWINI